MSPAGYTMPKAQQALKCAMAATFSDLSARMSEWWQNNSISQGC